MEALLAGTLEVAAHQKSDMNLDQKHGPLDATSLKPADTLIDVLLRRLLGFCALALPKAQKGATFRGGGGNATTLDLVHSHNDTQEPRRATSKPHRLFAFGRMRRFCTARAAVRWMGMAGRVVD